jgi:hypothetical protein
MGIAYVVDVYRGDFTPVRLGTFAAYLSFFPHLVAGPIVRPGELIPQMSSPRDPRYVDTSRAFFLIGTGPLHEGRDRELPGSEHRRRGVRRSRTSTRRSRCSWGSTRTPCRSTPTSSVHEHRDRIALVLGFQFPQNFDAPYAATSITDFWRRWHMTLSRWLRDYLYIPLGGNRGGTLLTYRNLMLTMLIGGLWHGAGWTFVVWGGIPRHRALHRALVARTTGLRRAAWTRGAAPGIASSRSRSSASPGSSSAPTRSRTRGTHPALVHGLG